jgi:hypothetical protein
MNPKIESEHKEKKKDKESVRERERENSSLDKQILNFAKNGTVTLPYIF